MMKRLLVTFDDYPLLLALVMVACTLPFVLLIGPRFLSWPDVGLLIAVLVVGELLACWMICNLGHRDGDGRDGRLPRDCQHRVPR